MIETKAIELLDPEGTWERFISKVDVRPSGCWLWTAAHTDKGYGALRVEGRVVYAHVLSLQFHQLFTGHAALCRKGLVVDHRCFQPGCVNPLHLRQVTQAVNTQNRAGTSSKTGVRNVYWWAARKKFQVKVQANYHQVTVGYFTTLAEAEEAAIAARLKLHPGVAA